MGLPRWKRSGGQDFVFFHSHPGFEWDDLPTTTAYQDMVHTSLLYVALPSPRSCSKSCQPPVHSHMPCDELELLCVPSRAPACRPLRLPLNTKQGPCLQTFEAAQGASPWYGKFKSSCAWMSLRWFRQHLADTLDHTSRDTVSTIPAYCFLLVGIQGSYTLSCHAQEPVRLQELFSVTTGVRCDAQLCVDFQWATLLAVEQGQRWRCASYSPRSTLVVPYASTQSLATHPPSPQRREEDPALLPVRASLSMAGPPAVARLLRQCAGTVRCRACTLPLFLRSRHGPATAHPSPGHAT